ncbi:hypothetical protein PCL_00865 [Purpureocillium lilacinum]|uniref:Uncharacterized protein n=1 Tax=Purpureocillium lilacinum TaxID=33203 RepID=A0A2U3E3Y6_PURLI|nr:hypothetical protein PCL_00865 [Purpureocillium lilacinum]
MLEKGHFERHDDDDGSMLLLLLLLLSSAVAAHMQDDAAPPPRPWCESDSRYYSPLSSAEIPLWRQAGPGSLPFRTARELHGLDGGGDDEYMEDGKGPRSKYSRREEREKPREDGEVAQQDRMQCSIVERLTESDKRPSTSPAAMAGLPFGRRFRPRRLAREPASQPVRRVCKEGLKIRKEAVIVGWARRRARAHTHSTDQQQQRAWLKVRAMREGWMMQERRLLRADGRKLAKRTGGRAAPVVDDWGDDDVQLGAEGDEKGEEGGALC